MRSVCPAAECGRSGWLFRRAPCPRSNGDHGERAGPARGHGGKSAWASIGPLGNPHGRPRAVPAEAHRPRGARRLTESGQVSPRSPMCCESCPGTGGRRARGKNAAIRDPRGASPPAPLDCCRSTRPAWQRPPFCSHPITSKTRFQWIGGDVLGAPDSDVISDSANR